MTRYDDSAAVKKKTLNAIWKVPSGVIFNSDCFAPMYYFPANNDPHNKGK